VPYSFLDIMFHSDGKLNYGRYSDPDVDELLVAAGAELDATRRWALQRSSGPPTEHSGHRKYSDDCYPSGARYAVTRWHDGSYRRA